MDLKRALKGTLGRLVYGARAHRLSLGNHAVIVLFHRVDDRLIGDPISCGVDEFRRWCAFFKRHFNVIGLGELVDKLRDGKPVGGDLVITFDDGYRDNYLSAAPILEQFGLPACFFIATGFIGTERVPWWDERLSFRPEWMTWDEVRALRTAGFEVGAHTVEHVDLGSVPTERARHEIHDSREQLEQQLGEPVPLFSYPYGRKYQITEDARDIVREAGFDCCVSAYGGRVAPGDDLFRLCRAPISPWYLTPHQFGFEILRESSEVELPAPPGNRGDATA